MAKTNLTITLSEKSQRIVLMMLMSSDRMVAGNLIQLWFSAAIVEYFILAEMRF